jgi:hypothetical protein
MTTNTNRGRRQVSPRVEELEDRQLLSVTVAPGVINLKGAGHGHGVFTVRVVSDTTDGKTLLQTPTSLTATVTDSAGTVVTLTPLRTTSADVNGDGTPDLLLKFSRSALKDLAKGSATLTVSNGTGGVSETSTITLFSPGHNGHHGGNGHHGHHGHGHHQGPPPGHGW